MKKIISLLLVLIMAVGMFSAGVINASADEPIIVDGKTLKGVKFHDIVIYEGFDRVDFIGYDEDEGEDIYGYMPDVPYTLLFSDGSSSEEKYNFWDDDGNNYYMETNLAELQLTTRFEAGKTYTATAEIAGFSGTFKVTVKSSPIKSVEIEDLTVFEYQRYVYEDEDPVHYEYYLYPNFTLTFNDGHTEKCEECWTSDTGAEYRIFVDYDQWNNPFETGKSYTVTGSLGGASDTFTVTVKENPIEKVVFDDVTFLPASHKYGYLDTDSEGNEYFHYAISWMFRDNNSPERRVATVYMKDGREIEISSKSAFDEEGNPKYPIGDFKIDDRVYKFECYDYTQDEPGEHYLPGNTYTANCTVVAVTNYRENEDGGYSYRPYDVIDGEQKVIIADSLVKSIKVTNPVLYEGIDFSSDPDAYCDYTAQFEAELQDGTVTTEIYGYGTNYWFYLDGDQYSINLNFPALLNKTLEADKTYDAYVEIAGKQFPVTFTTKGSPIESLSVTSEEIPLDNGYYDWESKQIKYYLDSSKVHVTVNFTDGSSKTVNLGSRIQIGGGYYYFDYGIISQDAASGVCKAYAEIGGVRKEFDVNIEKSNVSKMSVTGSITLDATKDATVYSYGDVADYDINSALSRNPLKINVTYKDGSTKTFTLKNAYNENAPRIDYGYDRTGEYAAVAIFGGKALNIPLKVTNASAVSMIKSMSLVKLPTFPCGMVTDNAIIWDGIQVKLTFKNGKTETATLTSSMRNGGTQYYYTAASGVKYAISFNDYLYSSDDSKNLTAYACGKTFTLKKGIATKSVKSVTILTAADKLNSEDIKVKLKFSDKTEKTVTLHEADFAFGIGGFDGYRYSSYPIYYDTGLGFTLQCYDSVEIKNGKAIRTIQIQPNSLYESIAAATGTDDVTKALIADMLSYNNYQDAEFGGTQTDKNTDTLVLNAVRYYEYVNYLNHNPQYTVEQVNEMVENLFSVSDFDASKSSYCKDGIITLDGEYQCTYVYEYNNTAAKNGNDTEFIIGYDNQKYLVVIGADNRVKKIDRSVASYSFKLASTSLVYTGKAQKPKVTASGLTEGKDFTVTYKNNTSAGTATATVKGITFSGSKTLTFKITPKQVTGLKLSTAAKTSLKLAWSKASGAKYYKLEKSTDGKKWSTVTTTTATSYTVKSLKAGTKYQFRVTALDSSKKIAGKASTVLKTGTLTSAPSVTLKSSKKKTATASWKKVTGAAKYVVYKSTNGKKWTKVTTTTKTSYILTKLSGGKKIYVKVSALNAYGKASAYSSAKKVTVKK